MKIIDVNTKRIDTPPLFSSTAQKPIVFTSKNGYG